MLTFKELIFLICKHFNIDEQQLLTGRSKITAIIYARQFLSYYSSYFIIQKRDVAEYLEVTEGQVTRYIQGYFTNLTYDEIYRILDKEFKQHLV